MIGGNINLSVCVGSVDRHADSGRAIQAGIKTVGKGVDHTQANPEGVKGAIGVVGERAISGEGNRGSGRQGDGRGSQNEVGFPGQSDDVACLSCIRCSEDRVEVGGDRGSTQSTVVDPYNGDLSIEAVVGLVEVRDISSAEGPEEGRDIKVSTSCSLRTAESLIVRSGPVDNITSLSVQDVEPALGVHEHTIDVKGQDVGSDVEGSKDMNVVSTGNSICGDRGDGLGDQSAVSDGQNQLVIDQNKRRARAISTGAPDRLWSHVVIWSDEGFHRERRGAEVAAVKVVGGSGLVGISKEAAASGSGEVVGVGDSGRRVVQRGE